MRKNKKGGKLIKLPTFFIIEFILQDCEVCDFDKFQIEVYNGICFEQRVAQTARYSGLYGLYDSECICRQAIGWSLLFIIYPVR